MNKNELVSSIAEKSGLTKKNSALLLDAFVSSVQDTLATGEKVALSGFGTFEVKERAERNGINPKTGEAIDIPASKFPKFKAGKTLKDLVNA